MLTQYIAQKLHWADVFLSVQLNKLAYNPNFMYYFKLCNQEHPTLSQSTVLPNQQPLVKVWDVTLPHLLLVAQDGDMK